MEQGRHVHTKRGAEFRTQERQGIQARVRILPQGQVGLRHALLMQRVGHPVARPSPPAPWPGQGRIAAALGCAMMVVVPRIAVGSRRNPHPRLVAGALPVGGAEGGVPLSAGARAGTGAGCGASGARDGGDGGGAVAFGGAEGGGPLSAGAKARTGAACGASGARDGGDGCGAVACGGGQRAARPCQPAPGPGRGRGAAPLGRVMLVMSLVPLPLASALHHTWSWRAILQPFGRVPYE